MNVEHGTFTPLILLCFGGMDTEAMRFFNRLGIIIAEKRDDHISASINLKKTLKKSPGPPRLLIF